LVVLNHINRMSLLDPREAGLMEMHISRVKISSRERLCYHKNKCIINIVPSINKTKRNLIVNEKNLLSYLFLQCVYKICM